MMMLMSFLPASSYDFEVDGIFYDVISLDEMTCKISGCSEDISELNLTSSIQLNGRTLKVIGMDDGAFSNKSKLSKVVFKPGVEAVSKGAFKGCINLSEINLGEIKRIGSEAFYDCPNIIEIRIPGSVESIGRAAFALTKSDTTDGLTICFESGETVLNGYAGSDSSGDIFHLRNINNVSLNRNIKNFGRWGGLQNLSIGDKVTIFPSYMGRNFNTLDLSNTNIEYIDDYAFSYSGIETLILPPNLKRIGENAFQGSSKLKSLLLPNSLKEIGSKAFYDSNIEEITLPNSIESVGEKCFSSCYELQKVIIPGSLAVVPKSAFYDCRYLENVEIRNGVRCIDDNAFDFCRSLTNIKLPNTLVKIGKESFRDTNLHSIIIPASVDTICERALGDAVKTISFEPSEKPLYFYSEIINEKNVSINGSYPTYGYGNYSAAKSEPRAYIANYQSPFIQESLKELSLGRSLITLSYLYGEDEEYPNIDLSPSYLVWNRTYSHMMGVSNSELEQITLYEHIQNPFKTKPALECHYNTYRYGTKLGSSRKYFTIHEHNNITNFAPVLSAGKLDKLKEIRCLIAEPPALYEDFPVGVYLAAKVYVPKGSLNKYKNAPYWKNFWSIEEVDDKVISISLPDAEDTLILGEEVTLNPVVEPDYAVNKKLRFSSSDSNIVSCNDAGELKAVGVGSATITISACDGSGVTLEHNVRVVQEVGFKNVYNTVTYMDMDISNYDNYFNYIPEITGPFSEDDFWIELLFLDKDNIYPDSQHVLTIAGGEYAGNYVNTNIDRPMYAGKYIFKLTPKRDNLNVVANPSQAYLTVNKTSNNLEWDADSPISVKVGEKIDLGITYRADQWCSFITDYDKELVELSSYDENGMTPQWYATGLKEGETYMSFGIICDKNDMGFYNFSDSQTESKWIKVEPSSGIEGVETDNGKISVRTKNGTIFIYNKPENSIVRVFNLQGSMIKETEDSDVKNLAKGMYVITVEEKSFKVML